MKVNRTSWRSNSTEGKTTTERGYGTAWQHIRKQVIARDQGMCVVCRQAGKLVKGTECDHIKPKAKGGTDALSNLQILCATHHRDKTAADNGYSIKALHGCDANGLPTDPEHLWGG